MRDLLEEHDISGPICHVGSKVRGKTEADVAKWRSLFGRCQNSEFIGLDLSEGLNVDVVADICAPDLFTTHPSLKEKFGFIFCSALLEHVEDIFAAAKNICGLLAPRGHLYYSGPWVWGYHPYPDDYWRISFSGLKVLFPQIEWRQKWYSGTIPRVGIEMEDLAAERKIFVTTKAFGSGATVSDRSMPYLNINAIGVLPDED